MLYFNVIFNILLNCFIFYSGFAVATYDRQRSPSPSEIDWDGLIASPKTNPPMHISDLLSPLDHSVTIEHKEPPPVNINHSESPTRMIHSNRPTQTESALKAKKSYHRKEYRKRIYQMDKEAFQALPPDEQEKRRAYNKSRQALYRARVKLTLGKSSPKMAELHHIRQLIKNGKATEEQKERLKNENAKANAKKQRWKAKVRQNKMLKIDSSKATSALPSIPAIIPTKSRTKRKRTQN